MQCSAVQCSWPLVQCKEGLAAGWAGGREQKERVEVERWVETCGWELSNAAALLGSCVGRVRTILPIVRRSRLISQRQMITSGLRSAVRRYDILSFCTCVYLCIWRCEKCQMLTVLLHMSIKCVKLTCNQNTIAARKTAPKRQQQSRLTIGSSDGPGHSSAPYMRGESRGRHPKHAIGEPG